MITNMKDSERDIKIAVIEEKVGNIEAWQKKADDNHFPTIDKRFDLVESRFDKIDLQLARWGGAITLLVILVPLLIKVFVK